MGPQPVNMEEWGVTVGTYAAECALGMQGFGSLLSTEEHRRFTYSRVTSGVCSRCLQ